MIPTPTPRPVTTPPFDRDAIPAVIVTHFPDEGFAQRVAAVAAEAKPVLVIDNSADPATVDRLAVLCAEHDVEFLANDENAGLGTALNRAFSLLFSRGHRRAIAFDQDSAPQPGFLAALRARHDAATSLAAIGANWHDARRPGVLAAHLRPRLGLPGLFTRVPATGDLADVTCVITSGTLFDLEVWRKLGGFDEDLFLDLIDTDYCLRAHAAGYCIAVATGARLEHRRGAKRPVRAFGSTWWPAFMPPFRLRLLYRNRLLLFRRHALRQPHWAVFELFYGAKVVGEILFLEDHKAAKLSACLRGTWEGILGRSGRPVPPMKEQPHALPSGAPNP